MTYTEKKIAEIREALEKATPGPWRVIKKAMPVGYAEFEIAWSDDGELVCDVVYEEADARLIAKSPEWLRFLLEERAKLIEGLRSIRKELDRRFWESDQKWEREADMYEQGKSAAYDEADALICDILREIGVNVDGHSHQMV